MSLSDIKRYRNHHLQHLKANEHAGTVATERQKGCDTEPPPIPPKLPAKTYKKSGSLKTTGNDNDVSMAPRL